METLPKELKLNNLLELTFLNYDGNVIYKYIILVNFIDMVEEMFYVNYIKTVYAKDESWTIEKREGEGIYPFSLFADRTYNVKVIGQAEDYPEYVV
jgi:hypothetical protein